MAKDWKLSDRKRFHTNRKTNRTQGILRQSRYHYQETESYVEKCVSQEHVWRAGDMGWYEF